MRMFKFVLKELCPPCRSKLLALKRSHKEVSAEDMCEECATQYRKLTNQR